MTLPSHSVGVLNASYESLGYTKMSRAVSLVLDGKAEVIEALEHTISSVSGTILQIPKVIRLLKYVSIPFVYSREFFSRQGLLKRDNYTCAYCGKTDKDKGVQLTWDHILPRSRGGQDTWENAITACKSCNLKKANRTPEEAEMTLLFQPTVPYRTYLKSGKKARKRS